MTLSLDTNVAVDLLRGRRPDIRERYNAARRLGEPIVLSTVALAELAHGVRRSARPDAQVKALDELLVDVPVIDFDAGDAMMAGSVSHQLETPGQPFGVADVFIAAQALNRGWTIVTNDIGHFGRVQGLPLIDWRASDVRLDIPQIIARLTRSPEDT